MKADVTQRDWESPRSITFPHQLFLLCRNRKHHLTFIVPSAPTKEVISSNDRECVCQSQIGNTGVYKLVCINDWKCVFLGNEVTSESVQQKSFQTHPTLFSTLVEISGTISWVHILFGECFCSTGVQSSTCVITHTWLCWMVSLFSTF